MFVCLFVAPPAHQLKKKSRKVTVGKDPFSTDREYNIPKGGQFQLKQGDKKTTKFVEFKRGDSDYKVRSILILINLVAFTPQNILVVVGSLWGH